MNARRISLRAAAARETQAAAVRRVDEHRVTFRNGGDAATDLLDPAGVLMAEHARQRHAGGLHQAVDRVQVGGAHAGAADPHQHVAGVHRLGPRTVDQLERAMVLTHQRGFHHVPFSSEPTSC